VARAVLRGNACHCAFCALQTFKRLYRFIRFVIGVVMLKITDLTEYQDATALVVMYRDNPLCDRYVAFRLRSHNLTIGDTCCWNRRALAKRAPGLQQYINRHVAASWNRPPTSGTLARQAHLPCAQQRTSGVAYNIPANVTSLPSGAGDPKKTLMPAGTVQGRTDFGSPGYGGPCPPPGKPHRYYFRLYALKVPKLDVPADATAALIGFNVNANSLGKAEIIGVYGR
jgi:Raf kinase inhibitor-like YbhB/YbcL family protein